MGSCPGQQHSERPPGQPDLLLGCVRAVGGSLSGRATGGNGLVHFLGQCVGQRAGHSG